MNSLTLLTHENIVRMFYTVYETLQDHKMLRAPLGYAMEIMARSAETCFGDDKFQCTFDQLLQIFVQISKALTFAHEHDVIHFDVKPENILLNDSCTVAKLCDFGCARSLQTTACTASMNVVDGKVYGTYWYMAPEAIGGIIIDHQKAKLCDIYSLGKTMWKLLHPLEKYPSECKVSANVPPALKELVQQCTLENPVFRPQKMSEILHRLQQIQTTVSTSDTQYMLMNSLFNWQYFDDSTHSFSNIHPAACIGLEDAFLAGRYDVVLAPLDLRFGIKAMLSSPTALGQQTEITKGIKRSIRRVHNSALHNEESFPIWQELVNKREWRQCTPSISAKLARCHAIDAKHVDLAQYRSVALDRKFLDEAQLPRRPLKSEPYLVTAEAGDITMLNKRVQDSLPEWDVTNMVQVVNSDLSSKYASYRHRLAVRCNGDPNERMLFHFNHPTWIPEEVGKGAYFYEHAIYGYACKYSLLPLPPYYAVRSEPQIGESMELLVSLVCLGNMADMGPGCETCSSPPWDAWKNEFEHQNPDIKLKPKPTRPPAMLFPADAAKKQFFLDLNQDNDAPYYDSVCSTEGDLSTHPASTNRNSLGQRVCDILHPRLRAGGKEWGKQYVLFDPAASYPMFILTLTKKKNSHIGPLQLMEAGCDVMRIKTLGFNASHLKAMDMTVHEMRIAGWPTLDLKDAGFGAGSLLIGGCNKSELRAAGFTATQVHDAVNSFSDEEKKQVLEYFESVHVDLVVFLLFSCVQAATAALSLEAVNSVCNNDMSYVPLKLCE